MSSEQSFIKDIHDSYFGTLFFDRGTCMDVNVNIFLKSDGAPTIGDTKTLSGAVVTDSPDLYRTRHGRARTSMTAVDLVVMRSVKVATNPPH